MQRMWRFVFVAVLVFLASVGTALAGARVLARVDLSTQRLHLYVFGKLQGVWRVSTARRGYRTPVGRFRPFRMHRMWYSRKYHMSPMPYSLFFYHGFAIHGTYQTRYLGRRASHGCIRLSPAHARYLYGLVKRYGMRNTRIEVVY